MGASGSICSMDDENQETYKNDEIQEEKISKRAGSPQMNHGLNVAPRAMRGSMPSSSGLRMLQDANLNKGLTFSLQERHQYGLKGLLPSRIFSSDEEVALCLLNIRRIQDELDKYVYMMDLLYRNRPLFYKLLTRHLDEMMPIVYTPTVGLACQNYSTIYKNPQGLFLSIHDRGNMHDVLQNWPDQDVRAICVTDGERILGLGDLGAQGMGIPVGKLALYTALAGIPPRLLLPVTLDVGTNNEDMRNEPFYIGLNQTRITGQEYDNFIQEFMESVVDLYGDRCLIQFEDFGNHNAFRLLQTYRDKYCVFNDDIQGTASVAVAGILAGVRATNTKLQNHTFLFQGAGEAAIGIAKLLVMAMMEQEALSKEEAAAHIWLKDSRGLIVENRPSGGLNEEKMQFAHASRPIEDLEEIVKELKPSCLIGASAVPGAFTPTILELMASNTQQPIILSLSNPTSKSECSAEDAYTHTDGRAIFISGSPFPPVNFNGQRFEPGQGNNAYIFPGLGLGIISSGVPHVTEDMFLKAAEIVADMVDEEDLSVGRMYPPLSRLGEVSLKIAVDLCKRAIEDGTATRMLNETDVESYVKSLQYDFEYDQ